MITKSSPGGCRSIPPGPDVELNGPARRRVAHDAVKLGQTGRFHN